MQVEKGAFFMHAVAAILQLGFVSAIQYYDVSQYIFSEYSGCFSAVGRLFFLQGDVYV